MKRKEKRKEIEYEHGARKSMKNVNKCLLRI